jgi:hypothetical protein
MNLLFNRIDREARPVLEKAWHVAAKSKRRAVTPYMSVIKSTRFADEAYSYQGFIKTNPAGRGDDSNSFCRGTKWVVDDTVSPGSDEITKIFLKSGGSSRILEQSDLSMSFELDKKVSIISGFLYDKTYVGSNSC